MALPVGSKAPDFTLKTSDRKDFHLYDELKNGPIVLAWFPAAFSGVCTQEFCTLNEGLDAYKGYATVVGISVDSPYALAAWAEKNDLNITLLSDYTHKNAEAFDVVLPDFGGLGPGAKRAVFVIDRDGTIVHSEATPAPGELPDFDAVKSALAGMHAKA